MHVEDLLLGMRSGTPQPSDAIEAFVTGVVDGSVSRPQAAAWLAWAFARGLSPGETEALTAAMTRSGEVLAWPDGPLLIDKHSTGGVGDKTSLVLAPLWAELGLRVPMLSGRGLGHTGGTLDKLEAIPGLRTDLSVEALREILAQVGCFVSGQTERLAPADRVLYALRDEIQAVSSIPLIVASILSKKLAEGVRRLVLDVKTGSGAFMAARHDAEALARALVDTATAHGVDASALVTRMGRPLGRAVGNAVEVAEAVACLAGGGPPELRALVLELAGHHDAAAVLDDGRALERFARMVEAQGGDARVVDDPRRLLGGGVREAVLRARHAGVVARVDALAVGRAAFLLGAGRRHAEDPVDPGVGVLVDVEPGATVGAGDALVRVLHRGVGVDEALALLDRGVVVGDDPVEDEPLVIARIGSRSDARTV